MEQKALQKLSYGLYIIGSKAVNEVVTSENHHLMGVDGRNVGCVVNTVFQVTSADPYIAVSINKNNYTHDCILQSGVLTVSVLTEKADAQLIGIFGFQTSRDYNKYEKIAYESSSYGATLTEGVNAVLKCTVVSVTDAGTHSVILAKVEDADIVSTEPSMTYDYYHRVVKGSAPKNAPTYVAPEEEKKTEEKQTYVCNICGYVHEGSMEDEPEDYHCPICGVDKSHFELK